MTPLLRRWLVVALIILSAFLILSNFFGYSPLSTPERRPKYDANNRQQAMAAQQQGQVPKPQPVGDGPFNWADLPLRNPVTSMIPLPTGPAAKIPRIQYDFSKLYKETAAHKEERETRLAAVKEAFSHSWKGYRENAWLHDEVKPLSGGPHDPFGGWGATLVDTLDTLLMMGMEKDFAVAVAALDKIDFSRGSQKDVNIFETTIRYLGGFLAAYDLSEGMYPTLLEKAIEVAEMIYRAFDTSNRMPITRWDWQRYLDGEPQDTPKLEIVAELGSLTMEFTRLSQLTSDPKYFDAVQRISNIFYKEQNHTLLPGLWPLTIDPLNENFHTDTTFTVGGMADSVFEYLPKTYLLLQGREQMYADMHTGAAKAMKAYLTFEALLPPTPNAKSHAYTITPHTPLFFGTTRMRNKRPELDPRSEHLTCFAGGMLALGAAALSVSRPAAETAEDMDVARRHAQGCVWSYASTRTRIGPEIYNLAPCRKGRDAVTSGAEPDWANARGSCTWDRSKWLSQLSHRPSGKENSPEIQQFIENHHLTPGFTHIGDQRYMLRPEAIESLFVLWRITGDEALQDAAWEMFSAIVKWTRTDIAFAALPDVFAGSEDETTGKVEINRFDGMESFWTAETLKYFYLMFADTDLVSLDEYVFNTEAHPFRWRTAKEVPKA